MIRQDFIMNQIEELSKKIARLLRKKENHEPDIDTTTDECYGDLKLNLMTITNETTEDIIEKIPQWELLELLVTIMINDDRINTNREMMKKAQEILFYVQEKDKTWSFERTQLSGRLSKILK
ncbi:hypothetical protein [Coprobacter tertius]|uniref:Uncharacterized protein n=1 Tax=Coprobacter tertius TaxID=2944915 RepID=A0ABT1MKC0_9BACT|nr:hypothetical protein [Coprobacter tertius]MCP9613065.1 hypothetical protein [Coprobacter tertius]